jgi:pimeloyl-ACP methyl ester carboxylesterase
MTTPPAAAPAHATDQGRGAPALVFVHGFSCSRTDWAPQVSALSATHRCIAIDLPGHGDTPACAEASIAALGASVNATLDALGARDVVLIGHSMGCRVVSEACDRDPARVRGLVYVDGSFIEGDPAAIVAATEAKIDALGIEPFLAGLYREFHVDATPQAVREAVDAHLGHIDRAFARRLVVDMVRWDSTRARAVLRSIGRPVLAIQSTLFDTELNRVPVRAGELTPFSRALLDCVPGARIETIACGHFTMLEAPERTNALIGAFVGGLGSRPATFDTHPMRPQLPDDR